MRKWSLVAGQKRSLTVAGVPFGMHLFTKSVNAVAGRWYGDNEAADEVSRRGGGLHAATFVSHPDSHRRLRLPLQPQLSAANTAEITRNASRVFYSNAVTGHEDSAIKSAASFGCPAHPGTHEWQRKQQDDCEENCGPLYQNHAHARTNSSDIMTSDPR
jgi:hypothetical protein